MVVMALFVLMVSAKIPAVKVHLVMMVVYGDGKVETKVVVKKVMMLVIKMMVVMEKKSTMMTMILLIVVV